jgi:hypothetical protein
LPHQRTFHTFKLQEYVNPRAWAGFHPGQLKSGQHDSKTLLSGVPGGRKRSFTWASPVRRAESLASNTWLFLCEVFTLEQESGFRYKLLRKVIQANDDI